MAAGLRVGLDGFFYLNSATYGSPTWGAVPIVTDMQQDVEIDKAEVKSRASVWTKTLPTHIKGPISFKMVKDTSDANYALIRAAATGRTKLDVAVADGAIATSGTEYFRSEVYVYKFFQAQPIDGINMMDVEMDVAFSSNDPSFTTAS